MTRDYELGIILNSEVNEDQTRGILDRVEQIVTTYGGQTVKVNQWGRRRLAYPIEHQRDGVYIFIDMILTPETVSELERTLKVSEVVLRHMMKKRDPKAIQKEREEREARAAAAAIAAIAPTSTPVEGEVEGEEQPIVSEDTEESAPIASEAELEDVPPAIEEEEEEEETVEP